MPKNDIVQVQFKSRYSGGYGEKLYTYIADVPLAEGDIVTVPTRNGDGEARVARIHVPETEVEDWMRDRLMHITTPATVGGGLFDGFFN